LIELNRIVWGITGSGDRIEEILDHMIELSKDPTLKITVIVSKAGEQVLRLYKLWDTLNHVFDNVKIETNANVPFIAGPLQIGKYDALVVAPLTANSTAKIAHGIADTLITNVVAQTLKGSTPVILYPVDQSDKPVSTTGPDGTKFSITPRNVDLENVRRLRDMDGVVILTSPSEMVQLIRDYIER
jgi:archaeoflavoprotein AfpA